jgi:hypothetical protein
MKRITTILAIAVAAFFATTHAQVDDQVPASERDSCPLFVDVNGDGINDNAPDHDGDGIVNHLDSDYVASGSGFGKGAKGQFIDENGDGINDLAPDDDGDGIPNGKDADYVRQGVGRKGDAAGTGMGNALGGRRGGAGLGSMDCDGVCDLEGSANKPADVQGRSGRGTRGRMSR